MTELNRLALFAAIVVLSAASLSPAKAEVPAAIAAPDEVAVANVHAEGAQVYECKADAGGKLIWQFREPIATLLVNGRTVGRHFAGPSWEFIDGSAVTAKLATRAPGATASDIPWLKLEVTTRRDVGRLVAATSIQRINTEGGALEGACEKAGVLMSVPYKADYTFLQKAH